MRYILFGFSTDDNKNMLVFVRYEGQFYQLMHETERLIYWSRMFDVCFPKMSFHSLLNANTVQYASFAFLKQNESIENEI